MKALFIISILIWSTNTFGQTLTTKAGGLIIDSSNELKNDTSLKVVYVNKEHSINKPAYFLNGKFVGEGLMSALDPKLIENVNVIKQNIQINNIIYYGKIEVKTKDSYKPKIISLREIKEKYTNLKGKSAIFMIDGVIVNADYDDYLVDENYILKIVVDKIENIKENIDLGLIKLLTKSEENIRKSKEIRIRGTEVVFTK